MALAAETDGRPRLSRLTRESAVVRFAGDSGDGMQLAGAQFTLATAFGGSDLATFPDFPAEIRAPVGTTFGVSAFQIHFGSRRIDTVGDRPDLLVALNPAALKVNIGDLEDGALVIVDKGSFTDRNVKKAGYTSDPREDGSLDRLHVLEIDLTALTKNALTDSGLTSREQLRCKNFAALGVVLWMFDRDLASSRPIAGLSQSFATSRRSRMPIAWRWMPAMHFGETAELHHLAKL